MPGGVGSGFSTVGSAGLVKQISEVRLETGNTWPTGGLGSRLAHAARPVGLPYALVQSLRNGKLYGTVSSSVKIELYERGASSGAEQWVDQCLQVHMLRVLADVQEPGIAVLLTGDGAGYDSGAGFHADLERLQNLGWGIEVLAWDAACRKSLKDWAKSVGVYIPLDDYYDSVTFVQGGRYSQNLSLTRRPTAKH